MRKPDHYETLQITPGATPETIKQAFRKLARQYHPDLNPQNPQAAEIFRQVREAYDVLGDPIRRYYYDRERHPNNRSTQTMAEAAHRCYIQGVECELARNYRGALDAYDQALEHQPAFVEALLRRCGVRYLLEKDRLVLEDCHHLLRLAESTTQLSAHALAQVYYFQGLARSRLGYTQSAIEAFSQAIAQEPDYAQAHYHLGLTHLELQETAEGLTALEQALTLFQEQGDGQGYRRVLEHLETHRKTYRHTQGHPGNWTGQRSSAWISNLGLLLPRFAFRQIARVLLDPSGSLLPTYGQLNARQATQVGGGWLCLAFLGAAIAAVLQWPQGVQTFWPSLSIVGVMALLGLLLGLSFTNGFRMTQWSRLLFVAGAALLPFSLLCLLLALVGIQLWPITASLLLVAVCYVALILFSGLTQVLNVPESRAALAVPLLMLTTGWLTYLTFISLIPRPALDSIQI